MGEDFPTLGLAAKQLPKSGDPKDLMVLKMKLWPKVSTTIVVAVATAEAAMLTIFSLFSYYSKSLLHSIFKLLILYGNSAKKLLELKLNASKNNL